MRFLKAYSVPLSLGTFWLIILPFLIFSGIGINTTISEFIVSSKRVHVIYAVLAVTSIGLYVPYVYNDVKKYFQNRVMSTLFAVLLSFEALSVLVPSTGSELDLHGIIAKLMFALMATVLFSIGYRGVCRRYMYTAAVLMLITSISWVFLRSYGLITELLILGIFHSGLFRLWQVTRGQGYIERQSSHLN